MRIKRFAQQLIRLFASTTLNTSNLLLRGSFATLPTVTIEIYRPTIEIPRV